MKAVFANLVLVEIAFAIWLRADSVYVTEGKDPWWGEPVFWSSLLVCFAMNVRQFKGVIWRRITLALITCVAVCSMVLALVLTFGIPYHFSIGGRL